MMISKSYCLSKLTRYHLNKSIILFNQGRLIRSSSESNNVKNNESRLLKELAKQIQFTGPLTVNDYMRLALTHPKYGFYMQQDVFGTHGHFITSPEISQIFGEVRSFLIYFS